jgi:large subunit ribosomal protein L24
MISKVTSKPRKSRKELITLPLHARSKEISAHLNEKLSEELKKRSLSLRKGDKVKIIRGEFKGKEGKITLIDRKKLRVAIEKIVRKKSDGAEYNVLIAPSNLLIIDIDKSDKKRFKK